MPMTDPRRAEAEFYRALNAIVAPLVRAGLGAPGLLPFGAIVIETTGRRSRRRHAVPLLGAVVGDLVIVSTVRGSRSQWAKNLIAQPEAQYFLAGQGRPTTARVIPPGGATPNPSGLSAHGRLLAAQLALVAATTGLTFAILAPRTPPGAATPPPVDSV